jgi:hypothetical protein
MQSVGLWIYLLVEHLILRLLVISDILALIEIIIIKFLCFLVVAIASHFLTVLGFDALRQQAYLLHLAIPVQGLLHLMLLYRTIEIFHSVRAACESCSLSNLVTQVPFDLALILN